MKANNKFQAKAEFGAKGTACRRILPALAALMIVCGAMAQSQRGVVRTAQRPGKQAQKLAGVTIRLRGGNAAVTSTDGAFALGMDGARAGDALYLQSVRKIGYELVDKEIVGRALAYSPNVPLEIVMLNSREKEEDMQRIYDNAYRRAEQTYAERNAALERQLNDKTVSEEAYRQQLQELQQWFDKYQTLINDMAERYASMDYATIDTLNMAINEAIERGDMEHADSLISTAGSLEKLVSECMEERQATARRQAAVDQFAREVEAEKQRNCERTRSTGELLYSKYSTCLARAMNDSAARYITLRADLDTTNVAWQTDAAGFLCEYVADYDRAMALYQRALRNAVAQHGDNSGQAALAYNGIGTVCIAKAQYAEALDNFNRALETSIAVNGENHETTGKTILNIGLGYECQGKFTLANQTYAKALAILRATLGDDNTATASAYNRAGSIYITMDSTAKALECFNKALAINKKAHGENHPAVASLYSNIGDAYNSIGQQDKAMEQYAAALAIRRAIYGENHPEVANLYNNMGNICVRNRAYDKAMDYYSKALAIRKAYLDPGHPQIAAMRLNIATIHHWQGNYDKALDEYEQALAIIQATEGVDHPTNAVLHRNIGLIHQAQKAYDKALTAHRKALDINLKAYGEDHPRTITNYVDIYSTLANAAPTAAKYADELKEYMAEMAFTERVRDSDSPAAQQGLSGEYYLLEFEQWTIDSLTSILEYSASLAGKPKTLTLMKDGRIERHHFADRIGTLSGMKHVGRKEKERIEKTYRKWKAKQK